MAEPKTKPTDQSVESFLANIPDEGKRQDAFKLLKLLQQATRAQPQMWGSGIVGFGRYRYCYASGREGEWPLIGFSPRKQNLTLYIMSGFEPFGALLGKLGKHKLGKGCLYINRLDDVDLPTLKELVKQSVKHMRQTHA